MSESLSSDTGAEVMPRIESVTHYISVMSWLEMIAVGVALVAVLWAYRRHRQSSTTLIAAGLLLLLGRYGVSVATAFAELKEAWVYWMTFSVGALAILFIAGGCVVHAWQRPRSRSCSESPGESPS